MSIQEYAAEMGYTVQEVLGKCNELGIKKTEGSDILDDDDIIVLDNSMNLISTDTDATHEDNDVLDDAVEEILKESNFIKEDTERKQKLKKKSTVKESSDYTKKRKAMYKNKTKLMGNVHASSNIILYKEGMTVKDFADSLEVNSADIIKKLIGLGLMLNQNQEIDFETAEILVVDYKKVL